MKTLLFAFVCMLSLAVGAQTPQPPEIAARSYLLMDITSGQVLAEKDSQASVEPASLTKLMSAYLVFDALRTKKITLSQTLPVSVRAWKMEGSRMFIDPKMQVPVEDLIKGMIVQSGNDATVALAEGVGGTVEQFLHKVDVLHTHCAAVGRNPDEIALSIDNLTLRLSPLEFIQLASFLRMSIDELLGRHPGMQRKVVETFDIPV